MTVKTELKPCPFCGSLNLHCSVELTTAKANYYDSEYPNVLRQGEKAIVTILCQCGCSLTIEVMTLRDAVRAWNTRKEK